MNKGCSRSERIAVDRSLLVFGDKAFEFMWIIGRRLEVPVKFLMFLRALFDRMSSDITVR